MIHIIKKILKKALRVFKSKPYPKYIYHSHFTLDKLQFKVYNTIEEDRVNGSNSEIEFTEEIINELTSTDIYFDIGSCIGVTAISAAKLKGCKVYAFEPDPELRNHLTENIKLNSSISQINIVPWAVANEVGFVNFHTSGANGCSPSLAQTQDQKTTITVPTNTIDNAINESVVDYPSVIKIDIEGAEVQALYGMKKTLSGNNRPRCLFIESHATFLALFDNTIEEMQNFLKDLGYTEAYCIQRGDEMHHKFIYDT